MRKLLGTIICVAVAISVTSAFAADNNVTSKLDVEVYGYIKLDASYDRQKTAAGDLMFYVLPETDGKDDEFNMTAKQTRLGLNITVPDAGEAKISGKIETDFYGSSSANSPSPRLRLGYVNVAMGNTSIRAGQDWETFIAVIPKSLNFTYLADVGQLGLRRPQLRVTQVMDLADKTKLIAKVAAARTIGQDLDGGGQDDGCDAGFPTFQGNLMLETPVLTEKPTRIAFSGHWGQEKVEECTSGDVTHEEKNYDTWSIIGSLAMPIVDMAMIQGTIWSGENLDTYYGGIGQGVNLSAEKGIKAAGGWAQLVLNPIDKVNLNVGVGMDDPDDADLNTGDRCKNSAIFSSIYYDVLPQVTVAFEYTHMKTEYKDSDDGVNDRFQGAMIYSF